MAAAETIDRLIRFDGGGLPVASLYVGVPEDSGLRRAVGSQVSSLLHGIRPLAEDPSIDREARLSLRADIERLEDPDEQAEWPPGTVAIFACHGAGLFETVPLPRQIRERALVDATPWLRPMLAVLDEYHRACVTVVDRESARFWELYLGELRDLDGLSDETLRKPDFAGWGGFAEHGVRNRAEELAKRHYRRVSEHLDGLFRTAGPELLVIGGHHEEIPRFIDSLPRDLRGRVAGTFTVDPHTATSEDIRRSAQEVIDAYERDEERRWVAEALDKARSGGLGALGLEDCLWAGSLAAVQALLVQDGAIAEGVVCEQSHWMGTEGEVCPVCGGPTRHTPDVIDELSEAVIDRGGAVEHVLAETELQDYRVAAELRFPLPPQPESASARVVSAEN
jgi:Bacterial archaeo-eukaryotic release factor family 10